MKNHVAVYDFETDSANPETCEPVQLAACILNNITLDIVEGSEFSIYMRPSDIDSPTYFDEHLDTINWHARNYKCTAEEIFNIWKGAPDQKHAWSLFTNHLNKYNTNQSRKSMFTAPIRAGMNIRKFDDKIVARLCSKYGNVTGEGTPNIFHPRDSVDLLDFCFYWFESLPEPKTYNMDSLREFFGIECEGSHDALKDIRDEAFLIQKFLRLHRLLAKKVKFR